MQIGRDLGEARHGRQLLGQEWLPLSGQWLLDVVNGVEPGCPLGGHPLMQLGHQRHHLGVYRLCACIGDRVLLPWFSTYILPTARGACAHDVFR